MEAGERRWQPDNNGHSSDINYSVNMSLIPSYLSGFPSSRFTKCHEMCHFTDHDTSKLEPIIWVSLVLFLLSSTKEAGCVCSLKEEEGQESQRLGRPAWTEKKETEKLHLLL